MIYTVAGPKGGGAKTTTGVNVAVEFAQRGYRVVLVDSDVGQWSAANWLDRRNEQIAKGVALTGITVVKMGGKDLATELLELEKQFDVVIVDAGGHDSPNFRRALFVSDLAYVPMAPSRLDTETMSKVCQVLNEVWEENQDLKAVMLLTMGATNDREAGAIQARKDLRVYSDYAEMSEVTVHFRKAFRASMDWGYSVIDKSTPSYDQAAAGEIRALADEMIRKTQEVANV